MVALAASFAMVFALLAAYTIIRPVRDEMGVSPGRDALPRLFSIVFVTMLRAVPVFGAVASRFPRPMVLLPQCRWPAAWLGCGTGPPATWGKHTASRLGWHCRASGRQ